jgi:hypothetical protein
VEEEARNDRLVDHAEQAHSLIRRITLILVDVERSHESPAVREVAHH